MSLGKRIRAARLQKGLSGTAFGIAVGQISGEPVTKQAVSKWEKDDNLPSLSQFKAICKVLGVSADELLFSPDDEKDGLIEAIERLEPEERQAVAQAIRVALLKIGRPV